MKFKTVKGISLDNKTVLLRTDYNVPLDERGRIADDYRIRASLPTIQYLLGRGCKIIICSHLGRPDGKPNAKYSLRHVAERLGKLLDRKVAFSPKTTGDLVEKTVKELKAKQILMLENLRFDPGEEGNDKGFAKALASLADIFVQDAFGVVHRKHASTDAVTGFLPSVGGLLLEKEVAGIEKVMTEPERPMMAVIGGAKIADKIDVLERFIDMADVVAVGGAMANTFLRAQAITVGHSLYDVEEIPLAKRIMKRAADKAAKGKFLFYIPQDGVVAKRLSSSSRTRIVDWDAHVIAAIESYPKRPGRESSIVGRDEMILDIGPFSGSFIAGAMQLVNTVVWNGTMGVVEAESLIKDAVGPFGHGTDIIVEAMLGSHGHKPYTLVGGGDTVSYLERAGLINSFDHVSTGGGASLELMAGRKLPGVESLQDK